MNKNPLRLYLPLLLSAATCLYAAPTVQIVQVEKRPIERTSTQPATVEAYYSADLGVKVTGYVDSVPVDIGDRAKKGQALAIMVPDGVKPTSSPKKSHAAPSDASSLAPCAHAPCR